MFQDTVVLARRLGLARLGQVALAGTQGKANAANHKALRDGRRRQRAAQRKTESAALVAQAETQDATDAGA